MRLVCLLRVCEKALFSGCLVKLIADVVFHCVVGAVVEFLVLLFAGEVEFLDDRHQFNGVVALEQRQGQPVVGWGADFYGAGLADYFFGSVADNRQKILHG